MFVADSFEPKLRRVFRRSRPYEPVSMGDSDAKVVVAVYPNPFSDDSREFFDEVYDDFQIGALGDASVELQIRPIAPEMRLSATATSFDLRRGVRNIDTESVIAATDAAEFFHGVREAAGEDAFTSVVERACLVTDDDLLTYDRLLDFADDLAADVDGEALLRAVERGEYRPRVRYDSARWARLVGRATATRGRPNLSVFVDGEPLAETSYSGLRSQAMSRLDLIRTEREAEAASSDDSKG